VATPAVLLVDDYDDAAESTNGSTVIDAGTYTNALAATGYSFAYWKVLERGAPALADLQPFPVVIWRTTDDIINYTGSNNTLTLAQQTMIQTYLNGGGSFFMASMGILSQIGDTPFRANVLQVGGFAQNPDPPAPCDCDEYFGVPSFMGAPDDPVTSGMNVTLDYSSYPSFDDGLGDVFGPDFGDTFTPTTNSTAFAFEPVSGKCCGARFPPTGVSSPGRVVFLSFPLDTVPESGPTPDNETALLLKVLSFLDPGGNGVGTVTLNQSDYTVPSLVTVEVGDSTIAGAGQTQVTFSSSSFTNRVVLTLNETAHEGLFSGYMTLVATNTTVAGQLRVRNGDTLSASYFEASIKSNVLATALIDTNPPVITGVAVATNAGGAVVTWQTSEAADSLVQYGGGMTLGQTAYNAEMVTSHSITLSELPAKHLYYFEVVSRDSAGNAATNDNQGALYSFTTPATLQPPWFDNLESGAKDWTVVPDTTSGLGSSLNWTLGTPNNGLQTSAHSGVSAWGSDLDGGPIPISASSYLYSPVIDLTGSSQATLTFWDCFDFSEIYYDPYYYEQGQILISTDPSAPPANLPVAVDYSGLVSDNWEMETVDLTPYVGQAIQIVWDYLGFEGGTTYGWLVDDVGVTSLSAGAGGTIVVSKNLASGTFRLTGPISQTGSGLVATIPNAPPGQYVVQFGDVAFYYTPPAQTNTLSSSNALVFTGTYTFPDVNSNGMSDLYEQYYFGTVSTNRTRLTDTDGDGMSDYAEFIAGTDPTNAASNLRIIRSFASNGVMTAQWSAVPGRIYEVQTSTNLPDWTPVSLWLQASNSPMTYTWTNASDRARWFRVEVRP
jgi:hypothetical protein